MSNNQPTSKRPLTEGAPLPLKSPLNLPLKRSFLASVSLLSLFSTIISAAHAENAHFNQTKAQNPNRAQQSNEQQVEFKAAHLSQDENTGEVIAKGNVTLKREGYTLIAGMIRYNPETGNAVATGAVQMTDPDGNVIWSDRIELKNQLKDAFVSNIRLIMKDGAQVAAQSAVRDEQSGRTTLNRAVYSPCDICDEDGNDKNPLWQIKAVKVVHDKGKRRLYYDDAYLELFGVPILWLPRFSHPDPTVDRANGLLPVEMGSNNQLGFMLGLPYYHSFNKSSDITIKPIITTREGLILAADYRRHLGYGMYQAAGSITYTDERDTFNKKTGENEFRGHIFSEGMFKHTKNWRSRFQLNWASDDTYLRRYDFSNADTLTSQYQLEGFFGQSYVSARTVGFQGLRVEDITDLTGHALPLIEGEYIWDKAPIIGTLSFGGNAMMIYRPDGTDTQRLSAHSKWQHRSVHASGVVFQHEAMIRSDFYNINDAVRPDDTSFQGQEGSEFRGLGYLSTQISLPMIKAGTIGQHIIEPIVKLTLSPETGMSDRIMIEDSRAFELSALNLFATNKTAGYDLWEEGSRVTYGLKYQYEGQNWHLETLIGQNYNVKDRLDRFAPTTGLSGHFSDYITQISLSYKDQFYLRQSMRLDDNKFTLRRHEIDIGYQDNRKDIRLGYFKLDRGLTALNREDREELRALGRFKVKDKWWLSGHVTQDFTNGSDGVEYGGGIEFIDDCISLSLQYRKTFTTDRDIEPGSRIMFRIKLLNLG